MSFKVKDLMVNVGSPDPQPFTCTTVTWTGACIDSLFDHDRRARHELSLLKAQLRRSTARA